jgi:hypothetical protein
MEIVGHSALDTTMNVYGHVELGTRRVALERWMSCWASDVAVNCCCQRPFGAAASRRLAGGRRRVRTTDPLFVRRIKGVRRRSCLSSPEP